MRNILFYTDGRCGGVDINEICAICSKKNGFYDFFLNEAHMDYGNF